MTRQNMRAKCASGNTQNAGCERVQCARLQQCTCGLTPLADAKETRVAGITNRQITHRDVMDRQSSGELARFERGGL